MVIEMSPAFTFNDVMIDNQIKVTSPGVYLLGYTGTNGVFQIERVGRSDVNLNLRLKSAEYRGKFREFKARYCPSMEVAFHEECQLWHAYGGTLNPNHPARPAGMTHLRCKLCPIFN
jgi:hypothetical protein